MDLLEYQQANALTLWPFKDNATLLYTNGSNSGQLPLDIILDAAITIGDGSSTPVSLVYISYKSDENWVIDFTRGLRVTISVGSTGIITYPSRNGANLIRLVVDTDSLASYFNSLSFAGTFTFDGSSIFCASVVKYLPPSVTELKFENTTQNPWYSSPATTTISDNVSGNITLQEGTNTQFIVNNGKVTFNVQPNLGMGLYDACSNTANKVITINNIPGNNNGNYFIGNDLCINNSANVNAITLNNNCLPACEPAGIVSLAHYVNRLMDATTELSDYLLETEETYNELLARYNSIVTTVVPPYMMAQFTNQANQVNNYINISCGIYNPNNQNTIITLQAAFNPAYALVPDTTYVIQNNNKFSLPDPVVSDGNCTILYEKAVNCASSTFCGFVLMAPLESIDQNNPVNDIIFTLSTVNGGTPTVAGIFTLAILSVSFNFNISTSISHNTTQKFVTLTVDLNDPAQPANSATTLEIDAPTYFTLASSQLTLDGVTSALDTVGFNSININYNKINQYILVLSCNIAVTGSQTISINGYNSSGSNDKTITFTL